jgi:hypothetical protein
MGNGSSRTNTTPFRPTSEARSPSLARRAAGRLASERPSGHPARTDLMRVSVWREEPARDLGRTPAEPGRPGGEQRRSASSATSRTRLRTSFGHGSRLGRPTQLDVLHPTRGGGHRHRLAVRRTDRAGQPLDLPGADDRGHRRTPAARAGRRVRACGRVRAALAARTDLDRSVARRLSEPSGTVPDEPSLCSPSPTPWS